MQTLNQHISLFETFATDHKQINDFGNGDLWELTEKETPRTYPLMWVQVGDTSIDGNTQIDNYTVLFCDQTHSDESDENEVLSDQKSIALDFLAWLKFDDSINVYNNVIYTSSLSPFTERFEDTLSGWVMTVQIKQPMQYNSCDIPIN
jgi:hypothetical protein